MNTKSYLPIFLNQSQRRKEAINVVATLQAFLAHPTASRAISSPDYTEYYLNQRIRSLINHYSITLQELDEAPNVIISPKNLEY